MIRIESPEIDPHTNENLMHHTVSLRVNEEHTLKKKALGKICCLHSKKKIPYLIQRPKNTFRYAKDLIICRSTYNGETMLNV